MADTRAILYHNLYLMLDAGVPILKSLRTVGSGVKGKRAKTFAEISDIVADGNSLAEAMARFPKVFDPLDVLVVEAGETSGNLSEILNDLSDWYNFRNRIKRTILSGLVLPVMIIHIAAFLIPVPLLILGGIGLSGYFRDVAQTLALLYVPAVSIWAIVHLTPRTGPLRRLLDRLVMRIPLLGRAIRRLALSRYCRTFHMLLKAGVSAGQCAEIAAEVVSNTYIADQLKGAAESARAGNLFSEGFSQKLPLDFLDVWRIGEETGALDDVTQRLARSNSEIAQLSFSELSRWVPRIVYFLTVFYLAIHVVSGFKAIMPV